MASHKNLGVPAAPAPELDSHEKPESPHFTLFHFVEQAWKVLEPISKLEWNWHLDLICEYLTLVRDEQFKPVCGNHLEGIIFNVPPRTMKSLLISVFFPVWVWTTHPSRRFMFVSYSEKLSTQHSVFRRMVIDSDFYQQRWGKVFSFSKDQNLKSHYENSQSGAMFSTGMQATPTGLGGDILIFDDPLNPEQAISQAEREAVNLRFDATFRSRINNPATGVKIVIMQRLHELDLTGHILAREKSRWHHVSLPATADRDYELKYPLSGKIEQQTAGSLLWSARLSQPFLDGQRVGMGSWAFNGQYQQSTSPLEGGIIKRGWVRFYRELPEKFDFMVQSWDCTFSGGSDNDFLAGQVWACAAGKYYMLPYRAYDRLDFAPTMAAIKSCCAKFPQVNAILIEDKANGPAIISELQKEIAAVVGVNPEGGKLARAQATAPLWEAGGILLPDPQLFGLHWMDDYLHNICTFPKAAHDDDVDATSQALIWMRTRLGGGIVDFYRSQATGELAPESVHNGSERSRKFLSRGPRAPSPAHHDPALVRNVLLAIEQGNRIDCHPGQYALLRPVLLRAATGSEEESSALWAQQEVNRLDQRFGVPPA